MSSCASGWSWRSSTRANRPRSGSKWRRRHAARLARRAATRALPRLPCMDDMPSTARQTRRQRAKPVVARADRPPPRPQVLESSEIVASTLVGAGIDTLLRLTRKRSGEAAGGTSASRSPVTAEPFFDTIIVDEATQACELDAGRTPTRRAAALPRGRSQAFAAHRHLAQRLQARAGEVRRPPPRPPVRPPPRRPHARPHAVA